LYRTNINSGVSAITSKVCTYITKNIKITKQEQNHVKLLFGKVYNQRENKYQHGINIKEHLSYGMQTLETLFKFLIKKNKNTCIEYIQYFLSVQDAHTVSIHRSRMCV